MTTEGRDGRIAYRCAVAAGALTGALALLGFAYRYLLDRPAWAEVAALGVLAVIVAAILVGTYYLLRRHRPKERPS